MFPDIQTLSAPSVCVSAFTKTGSLSWASTSYYVFDTFLASLGLLASAPAYALCVCLLMNIVHPPLLFPNMAHSRHSVIPYRCGDKSWPSEPLVMLLFGSFYGLRIERYYFDALAHSSITRGGLVPVERRPSRPVSTASGEAKSGCAYRTLPQLPSPRRRVTATPRSAATHSG